MLFKITYLIFNSTVENALLRGEYKLVRECQVKKPLFHGDYFLFMEQFAEYASMILLL